MPEPADNPWEDLVLAMLSVNSRSLQKTFTIAEPLREQGLFDPDKLVRWKPEEFGERLNLAGYSGGSFMTKLISGRLAALGAFIREHGIEASTERISGKDPREISEFLLPVNGVGPVVLANFFVLREIPFNP